MRADKYFSERYGSRSKAKLALLRGEVLRDGKKIAPDDEITSEEGIFFLPAAPFVSQGGEKLERGLSVFQESVEGCVIADLGASTGGFSDCVLRRGAKKVYCVDVGEKQLDQKIEQDERVVVMDRTNARYLTPSDFPEALDVVIADVSFISLRLILPAVSSLLSKGKRAFVLFKPQFECEGRGLSSGGILPRRLHGDLLNSFYNFCLSLSLSPQGIAVAPIREKKNVEYIVFLKKEGTPISLNEFMRMSV